MKITTLIAIVLIGIGIIAFGYQGISYTTRESVIDIGPMNITAEKTRTIPLPPIVGTIVLVGGVVLLVMARRNG